MQLGDGRGTLLRSRSGNGSNKDLSKGRNNSASMRGGGGNVGEQDDYQVLGMPGYDLTVTPLLKVLI